MATVQETSLVVESIFTGLARGQASRQAVAAAAAAVLRTLGDDKSAQKYDDEVQERGHTVTAALQAHMDLNYINGTPAHNLGCATLRGEDSLTKQENTALASVRKKANRAKHRWQLKNPDSDRASAHPEIVETRKQSSDEQSETKAAGAVRKAALSKTSKRSEECPTSAEMGVQCSIEHTMHDAASTSYEEGPTSA